MRRFCYLLFAACLFVGCAADNPPEADPQPVAVAATNTPAPAIPTDTPQPPTNTPTPQPTNTATPQPPTETPVPPTDTPMPTPTLGFTEEAYVMRVVDGDTIHVVVDDQWYSVRMIGFNTPETHHPDSGADYLGYEAHEHLLTMIQPGDTVVLETDITDQDVFDRKLRYVWTLDGTFTNLEMVRAGYAKTTTYEPDVKYLAQFRAAEKAARDERLGLHNPPPTRTAEEPAFEERDTVYLTHPDGDEQVAMRYDAIAAEPEAYWPVDLAVRITDIYWEPNGQQFWYWVKTSDFNYWVTADYLTDTSDTPIEGSPYAYKAYNYANILADAGAVDAYDAPGGNVIGQYSPNAKVQLRRTWYDPVSAEWWYLAQENTLFAWIPGSLLDETTRVGG